MLVPTFKVGNTTLLSSPKTFKEQLEFFYKIQHLVPLEILKILYYSLFYSFISYRIAVWGFTYKTNVQRIFLLQKKIVIVIVMTFIYYYYNCYDFCLKN